MRKRTGTIAASALLLAAMLALGGVPAGGAPAAAAAAVEVKHDVPLGGRLVEEIRLYGRVVIRIRGPLGGLSTAERGRIVAQRLNDFLRQGKDPKSFVPQVLNGQITVTAGGRLLVTVDQISAGAQGFGLADLGVAWANNLRRAMGAETLATPKWADGRWTALAPDEDVTQTLVGVASWYGPGFQGRPTANGEIYDQNALTAAHKTLPFGTKVMVTNLRTGNRVIVRINDRGPFIEGRTIDLSRNAAAALDMLGAGVEVVRLDIVGPR